MTKIKKNIDAAAADIARVFDTQIPPISDHFDFSVEGSPDRPMVSGRALEYAQDQGALVLGMTDEGPSDNDAAFVPDVDDDVIVAFFADDLGF